MFSLSLVGCPQPAVIALILILVSESNGDCSLRMFMGFSLYTRYMGNVDIWYKLFSFRYRNVYKSMVRRVSFTHLSGKGKG